MKLDRAGIESRVPHAGRMCLLDAVEDWDEATITCKAAAPDATHPLARDGIVPAIAAVEYAAQATAVHGALLSGGANRGIGMLAKLGEVTLHAERLAPRGAALTVRAELRARSERGCAYVFAVGEGETPIASGTLLVALGAGATAP